MHRVLVAAAASVALAMGLSVSTASAAQVSVLTEIQASQASVSQCAPAMTGGAPVIGATSPSTGTATQVSVSSVPAACDGLALEVFVHDAAGTRIAEGSATASGNVTVTMGSSYSVADVAGVVTRIGGWIFPAGWTPPEPPDAPFSANCTVVSQISDVSGPCTITVTSVGAVQTSAHGSFQEVRISVSHSVPQPHRWTADFNVAEVPGLVVSPTRLGADWANTLAPQGCGEFPVVELRGADYQFAASWYIGEYPDWRQDICG